jgi:hypothetical protein
VSLVFSQRRFIYLHPYYKFINSQIKEGSNKGFPKICILASNQKMTPSHSIPYRYLLRNIISISHLPVKKDSEMMLSFKATKNLNGIAFGMIGTALWVTLFRFQESVERLVENNSSIFSLFLKIQVIFIAKVYCLYTTG